jgi:zinc protease
MKRAASLLAIVLFSLASLAQAPAPRASQDANKPQKPTAPGSTESGKPAAPRAGVAANWKQIKIPPLPAFKPQEPKRIALSNGMVIFLQEDHELPLIDGSITIRGGGLEVPADKTGMIGIYGNVWRLGGTEKLTGDQMDDYLESRAARVSAGGGMESTSLSWSCLKDDFNDVFNLAVDLLQHPAFREDKLTLAKTQARSGIARRNDDIDSIVGREMTKIAYGPDNPYGRIAEYDTIAAITRDDLVNFHKQHISPNNMIVGVSGDFDSAQMEAALRKAFESWPKGQPDSPPKVEFRDPKPGVYFAEKSDVNQSEIRMFHLGIQKNNPDLFAIDVMDEIFFSGGFSSRMMNEIRTKRGLAYSAGGAMSSPFNHPGIFYLSVGTKSQSTVEASQATEQMVRNMDKEPPTDAELRRAKDSILNAFIFRVDSKDKILSERMTYEYYGFPADWLERYRAGIEKVTLADVTRVAKQYIHPDKLAKLIVGNAQEFDKQLSTLGPVTTLDISIPPPGGLNKNAGGAAPAGPAGPANTPEAKALLAKVVNALGGKAKLQEVKSIKRTVDSIQKTPQGDMNLAVEQTVVYPDKLYQQIQTPMGPMTQVIAPGGSYMAMGGQSRDLPSSQAQEGAKRIHHDFVYVAQHADDPQLQVSLAGTQKVGNVDAQVLEIKDADGPMKWYIDPSNGLPVRMEAQVASQEGPAQSVTDYSNWKAVNGVMFPFAQNQTLNGEPSGSAQVKSVEVNPTVDPKLFEKPASSPKN